jgi:putative flippase GtrA
VNDFEFNVEKFLTQRPIIMQLLRFAAIGVINTALDFIILNFVSKFLEINVGLQLGSINIIGFSAATIQSYFWNRYWAFGSAGNKPGDLYRSFFRLLLVGGLGAIGVGLVLYGAQQGATDLFYLLVLVGFVTIEVLLWLSFRLWERATGSAGVQFVVFLIVSAVGLIINSVILGVGSRWLAGMDLAVLQPDLLKNIAKILATCVSLIWNFLGYKLIVFRK